jgi:hypothetical protein
MAGRSRRLKAGSRLRLFGALSAVRPTVGVDFARRRAWAAMQEITDWLKGSACRRRICGERHRRLGPPHLTDQDLRTSASFPARRPARDHYAEDEKE